MQNFVPCTGEEDRTVNEDIGEAGVSPAVKPSLTTRMTLEEMKTELLDRESKMKAGCVHGETDQWRVYQHIVLSIQRGEYLRLMVQASAGTGKSYLLTTVYLWCIVHGKKTKAAAPTGIAAANIEVEGTDVCANTIHTVFDLDTEFKTKLDLAKLNNTKVRDLMSLEILLLDEVSMMDIDCWKTIVNLLSDVDHNRRAIARDNDPFGYMHVILFGDFKQLPPATSKAPFIVDPAVKDSFEFRVLRQNRRVVTGDASRTEELEEFHRVLSDISLGKATQRVRDFFVKAYVRGARIGNANHVDFEGNTSVFSKRRYRDRWNNTVVNRIAKVIILKY